MPRRSRRRRGCGCLTISVLLLLTIILLISGIYILFIRDSEEPLALYSWFMFPPSRIVLATEFSAPCPGYPFLMPSSGLVAGLPYNSIAPPYEEGRPHPGIDTFGNGTVGTIPVYAAYDGTLFRESYWRAAVTIRHEDPLNPGQVVWTYYTHMADLTGDTSYILDKFPPGAREIPVKQGDLLGFQGEYNGGVDARPISMHLHFSVVKADANGNTLNEIYFQNTYDPTPYLGLNLNNPTVGEFPLRCLPPPGL